MAENEEFLNIDADADKEDEENKAAKPLWVRVANSTEYIMEVKIFTERAQRQEVQGFKVGAEIPLPIPGFEINPAFKMERPNVPLVHNAPGPGGPDPTVTQLAGYACEKFWSNADTDEKSKLVTLRITKIDAGGPQFPGQEGRSWTTTKKHKHGVIIIVDPDNPDQLLVIPAAGQFILKTRWEPHPNYSNPKLMKTYDPKKVKKA